VSIQQQFTIDRVPDQPARARYNISTSRYRYRIDDQEREWLSFHWHPRQDRPHRHLHVNGDHLRGLHIPTGQVSIAAVLRFLVTEMHVRPLHKNWEQVLNQCEDPL
jgi:hypothetical protein